jgi:hypothetical protein
MIFESSSNHVQKFPKNPISDIIHVYYIYKHSSNTRICYLNLPPSQEIFDAIVLQEELVRTLYSFQGQNPPVPCRYVG